MKATGTFDVTMKPIDAYATSKAGAKLGRMSLDKTFAGDLEGTSQGEMLTAMTDVQGSAGYVAIEQVEGRLMGKAGTFLLQHFGVMAGTESRLILEVVPDSATGELKGLSGSMEIINEAGAHSYVFAYTFAES